MQGTTGGAIQCLGLKRSWVVMSSLNLRLPWGHCAPRKCDWGNETVQMEQRNVLLQLWLGQGKHSVLRIDRANQAFADLGPESSHCGRAEDHKNEVESPSKSALSLDVWEPKVLFLLGGTNHLICVFMCHIPPPPRVLVQLNSYIVSKVSEEVSHHQWELQQQYMAEAELEDLQIEKLSNSESSSQWQRNKSKAWGRKKNPFKTINWLGKEWERSSRNKLLKHWNVNPTHYEGYKWP